MGAVWAAASSTRSNGHSRKVVHHITRWYLWRDWQLLYCNQLGLVYVGKAQYARALHTVSWKSTFYESEHSPIQSSNIRSSMQQSWMSTLRNAWLLKKPIVTWEIHCRFRSNKTAHGYNDFILSKSAQWTRASSVVDRPFDRVCPRSSQQRCCFRASSRKSWSSEKTLPNAETSVAFQQPTNHRGIVHC